MTDLSVDRVLWVKPGEGIAAMGRIPQQSEFFQDHFPGYPVLPGVLALEMLKQTAECYLKKTAAAQGDHYYLRQIRATKFHLYLKPGDEWESRLTLLSHEGEKSQWNAKLFHKGKVAVSAQLVLALSHAQQKQAASQGG